MDIINILNKLGYKTVSAKFYQDNITLWKDWYTGTVDSFHNYNVYNGVNRVGCIRKTLGMAKKVSEDKANLLLNEKVEINLDKDTSQKKLDLILANNNFWVKGNQLIELSQALGTGAIVEYLEGEDVKLDYIQGDSTYPLTWNNGEIVECAFASEYTDKLGSYIYLNIHILEGKNYVCINKLFDDDGKEVALPEGLAERWETGSSKPMFQIIKPNIVNNVDTTSPMGISVYANSIDVLQGIDTVYDSYDNEFILGKKRIFVDSTLLKVDIESGITKPIFDPNDTMFYGFPFDSDRGNNKPIHESDLTLRAEAHEVALENRLNLLSIKCGFGPNHYQFNKGSVKTATEVVSDNSEFFRNIRKDEIILEKVLVDMTRAILYLAKINPDEEVSIAFDDSIIEDTDATQKRALLELQSGLIDNIIYYQRVYGYTEEKAIKYDKEIKSRAPVINEESFYNEE